MKLGTLDLPFACVEIHTRGSSMKDLAYPGVDGAGLMDMGLRGRPVTITGFLPDAIAGPTTAKDIEGLATDLIATLDLERGDSKTYGLMRVDDAFTHNPLSACIDGVKKLTVEYTIELVSPRGSSAD